MRALPEGIPPKAGQVPEWSECPPEGLLLSLRDNSPCAPWNLHEATGRHVGSADRQSELALAPYRVRPPRGSCTLLNKRACPAFLRPLAGRPKGGMPKGGNALWRAFAHFWRVPKVRRPAGAQPRRVCARGQCQGRRTAVRKRSARSCKAKCKPIGRRPEAVPKKTFTKALDSVPVAAKQSANPLASGQGQAGPAALQCANALPAAAQLRANPPLYSGWPTVTPNSRSKF